MKRKLFILATFISLFIGGSVIAFLTRPTPKKIASSTVKSDFQQSQKVPLVQQNFKPIELEGFNEEGQKFTFQIRESQLDPSDPEREISLYTVFYRNEKGKWQNLCTPDAHKIAKAVVLQGSWDSTGTYHDIKNEVTFSCTNGALGKCVRFGYKSWKTIAGHSGRELHQTCLRMVRADYCGDGIGHTKNGTPINIYDTLELQKPEKVLDMVFEAAWTPSGAYCVNHFRWPELAVKVQQKCPEKLALTKTSNVCTAAKQARILYPNVLIFNDSLLHKHK